MLHPPRRCRLILHDGIDGFSRFLCQHGCHSALLQEPFCPHDVGCQDAVRTGFWQRLFASIDCVIRALPGVPLVIAGDSNVWFPGLVDSRTPRNADRGCLELIRLLLDTLN